MTMITPSYLGETIEYSSLHACRSTLEDPNSPAQKDGRARKGRPHREEDGDRSSCYSTCREGIVIK